MEIVRICNYCKALSTDGERISCKEGVPVNVEDSEVGLLVFRSDLIDCFWFEHRCKVKGAAVAAVASALAAIDEKEEGWIVSTG